MRWFSDENTPLPEVIARVALPTQTVIAERYRILRTCYVNGLELVYEAEALTSDETVLLCEFLPLRWCLRGDDGAWIPYHATAAVQLEAVTAVLEHRLQALQAHEPEAALLPVLDAFAAMGTLWHTVPEDDEIRFFSILQEKLYAAQEAITLLAPVLDTLAGLHKVGIFHGALSEQILMQRGEQLCLTGWCLSADADMEPSAVSDVQAVSRLLCVMMTGEREYRKEAFAAVPKAIGAVLQSGMQGKLPDIETLWKALHSSKARKARKMPQEREPFSFARHLNIRFAVCFALVCCAVPVLVYHAHTRKQSLQDTPYAIAGGEICMPELLYLPQEEAMAAAEACGLHVIVEARADNPTIPEGCVVTQYPSAGAVLLPGDTVRISISDGWTNYVPDVRNLLLEQAIAQLTGEGFVVEYEEVYSDDNAPGTVISQDIAPDTLLVRDSVIHLLVSLGREDVDSSKMEIVADYAGMDFEEAKAILAELHLYALQLEAVYDPEIPAGVIISQDIPKGKRVPQGTVINMVVSLGVEMTRVPSVGMMNASSARALMEEAGLKAVLVYTASSGYAKDCVISQNVAGGKQVPVGSEIWLTVSLGKDSYVVSTGGWSGNDLPEGETGATLPSEDTTAISTDPTEPTDATPDPDVNATDPTADTSETLPPVSESSAVTDPTEPTGSTDIPPTQPPDPTDAITEPLPVTEVPSVTASPEQGTE